MKKALNNYLTQHKEVFGNTLFYDQSDIKIEEGNFNLSLNEYKVKIQDCTKSSLNNKRNNFVFGSGNQNADIFFIGEVPEVNENLQGELSSEEIGNLLDKILLAVNLDRNDIYILNILKSQLSKKIHPSIEQINEYQSYLQKQLRLIKPKLIVALGRVSAMLLLKSKESLEDYRNKIHKYEGIDLLVTYHPSELLRNSNFKKQTWEDFKFIRKNYLDGK